MILGFRANINNDTHRVFLTRLKNLGAQFKSAQSKENKEEYSFIFLHENEYSKAVKLASKMSELWPDIPLTQTK